MPGREDAQQQMRLDGERSLMSAMMVLMPSATSSNRVGAVVDTIQQHHQLRLDPFQFAMAQTPDDVFGAISADAEIGGLQGGENISPTPAGLRCANGR